MLTPPAAAVARRLVEQAHQVDDAFQIPADEAALIHQIAVAARCRSVLEIGVSYGFSTLHLAHAMSLTGGRVHAIEASSKKVEHARANLTEAGVLDRVTLHHGRAQEVAPTLRPAELIDLLFIDAVKAECFEYLDACRPLLAPHCIILTDNTSTHWNELVPFIEHLRSHPDIVASTAVAVGNGFEFSVRRR